MVTEAAVGATTEPTLRDLSAALVAAYGTDYGDPQSRLRSRGSPTPRARPRRTARDGSSWPATPRTSIRRTADRASRPACRTRSTWAGSWLRSSSGTSPDSLLDTYQAERHPVAARVLRTTMAQVALRRTTSARRPLRETVAELLGMDEPRRRFAAMMSGLGIHYDLGEGHPLLGRRMPDLDLVTADGPLRVFTLLHEARPVLHRPRGAAHRRHRALGGSRPVGGGRVQRRVGASGARGRAALPRPSSFGPTATWRGWARGRRRASSTRSRCGSARRQRPSAPASYAGISPPDAFRAPSSSAAMTPPPMIATMPAT